MKPLSGKIALVTGAERNLGRAIGIDLARQGAQVAVHYYKSKEAAKKTLREVEKYTRGHLVRADLKRENEVISLFHRVNQALGGSVDILVNLIGNFIYKPIEKVSFLQFRDCIESNLYSVFLCCRRVFPAMQKKKWGRIVNFGCVGAETLTVRKKTTPYFIAKTGVIMLTKVLAYAYAKDGITINCVSPGILTTSKVKLKTPTGKKANFEDIINVINFLLKEKSRYINGANVEVAGGWRPGFAQ
jgi:NAD(P)-dependent dehydrogenase (short-subunit alcohol dehydrogenase family)